jgi:hypothetical protein
MVIAALDTGMGRGEVLNQLWEDVDATFIQNVLDLRSASGGIGGRGKARLEFRNVEVVLHT